MHGKRRTLLRFFGPLMILLALVMFSPTVSLAQAQTLQAVQDQLAQQAQKAKDKDKDKKSVPEPDTGVLLLLGIGVTGLVGYGMQYRKRKAEKSIP